MLHNPSRAAASPKPAKIAGLCLVVGLLVWLVGAQSISGVASAGQLHLANQPAVPNQTGNHKTDYGSVYAKPTLYATVTSLTAPRRQGGGARNVQSPVQTEAQPDVNHQELGGFKFVLDPGHGGTENHAVGPRGSLEKTWNLSIAEDLQPILGAHGAQVYMTRTCDCTVSLDDRTQMNNNWYSSNGGNPNNWRLISIHLNGGDPSANYTSTWYRYQTPNQQSIELANAAKLQIGRTTELSSYAWTEDLQMTRETYPIGYNILTESCFLTNASCENRLLDNGFANDLAYAHYRSGVDYWLVGNTGPHQNQNGDQTIYNEYWNNLNNGIDPGVPFDYGGGYYVHQWGDANTQEFWNYGTSGSILECVSTPSNPCSSQGGGGYYVRQPIWDTYVQKGGPVRNGPGRPFGTSGHEHTWQTGRGVRGISFNYPQTQNFENGVIYFNGYEGSVTAYTQNHAVFVPNCRAYDVDSSWATTYVQHMIGRFAWSNDATGPTPTVTSTPTPPPLPGYYDGGVHPNDLATRGQVAQSLMFAEGYAYYNGSNYEFSDVQGHWARPWVRIAASNGVLSGYADNTFKPYNYVTRGQFLKMLTHARGWALVTPTPTHFDYCSANGGYYSFRDVCRDNPFYSEIETAYAHNIISGYSDGTFQWGNSVTRAQMSKMIDSALTNDGYGAGPCWGNP